LHLPHSFQEKERQKNQKRKLSPSTEGEGPRSKKRRLILTINEDSDGGNAGDTQGEGTESQKRLSLEGEDEVQRGKDKKRRRSREGLTSLVSTPAPPRLSREVELCYVEHKRKQLFLFGLASLPSLKSNRQAWSKAHQGIAAKVYVFFSREATWHLTSRFRGFLLRLHRACSLSSFVSYALIHPSFFLFRPSPFSLVDQE
jgi:hypothetical protein